MHMRHNRLQVLKMGIGEEADRVFGTIAEPSKNRHGRVNFDSDGECSSSGMSPRLGTGTKNYVQISEVGS